ncbi:MAG: glycosyltransferase family 4 protein [Lentimicrobiaceae bacterium]|nr:glycosyltransferase family 4 protein [Lentimicrobiaceae bacterium]
MKINLIFDISLIGSQLKKPRWQTGLFRYSVELHSKLVNSPDLSLRYAHTAFPDHIRNSGEFISNAGSKACLCTRKAHSYPLSIGGRGKRYLDRIYQMLGLDVNRLVYNEKCFEDASVYHTPYVKIPAEIKRMDWLKRIITIHDLVPIIFPMHHQREQMMELLASVGSDYAICVSENTRNDLLNYDSLIDPDHVFVIHLAADPLKFYPCNDKERFAAVKQKYHLPEQYFLSLSTLEPRKNLDHVIRCFIRFLKEQNIHNLSLVLVGPAGWQYEKIYSEIGGAGNLQDRIILTGRIPDEDLAPVYSHAQAFFYMSHYEGFGFPPLEAMQCGVPTVTSHVSSLPEVVGTGGILIPPDDEDELCQTMYKLYSDSSFRDQLIWKAREQAKKFSWEKCAREHIEIYRTLAGISKP